MASIAPYGIYQGLDDNGDPLSGGFLYTYAAGTDTPKATYTTAAGNVENENPVELDASGQAQVWLGEGGYKFVLKDADNVTIFTTDNINAESPSSFGGNVNELSTNTAITSVYANSANICTGNITLSILAATDAGEGFYITVKNEGVGTVVIDPDASETIDGAATLSIGPGNSALIITDGLEWYSLFYSTVTASGNNVFTGTNTFTGVVAVNGTAATAAGISLAEDTDNGTNKVTYKAPDSIASDVTFVVPAVDGSAGYVLTTDGAGTLTLAANAFLAGLKNRVLNGLSLSNNGSDATNDLDVAAGACVSDDGSTMMTLTAIVGRSDANWVVGTNQGKLDTGAVGNNTYHVWVINRPDTNVTDVLFSLSASSPTMPANYTKKKCVGSFIRSGGSILGFYQNANNFYFNTPPAVYDSGAAAGTSAITATLAGPTGVRVKIFGNMTVVDNGNYVYLSSLDNADAAPSSSASPLAAGGVGTGATVMSHVSVWSNASGQIRARQSNSGSGFKIATLGWMDPRI